MAVEPTARSSPSASTAPAHDPDTGAEVEMPPVEWVSFEDAEGDSWIFDVSFLASPWTCIYGRGCLGIREHAAPELAEGCCTFGAHFTGDEDRDDVLRSARRLRPDQWQHHTDGSPLERDEEGAEVTRTVDGACIFLNRPGFPGGTGCALHIGALEAGERPIDWKPDVCWQLPLRLDELVDAHGHRVFTVREWKRRDWGEGGLDFGWWCTDHPAAFVGAEPVYVALREELVELVGEEPYALLAAYLDQRMRARAATSVPLPHPILRRRDG